MEKKFHSVGGSSVMAHQSFYIQIELNIQFHVCCKIYIVLFV